MMKMIASEGDLELFYTNAYASCRYILYKRCKGFKQELCRSLALGSCFKSWLKPSTIAHAKAMMHAVKYVSKKFKA